MHFVALLLVVTVGSQKGSVAQSRSVVFEARMVMPDGVAVPAADMLVVARSANGVASSGLTDAKGRVALPDLPFGSGMVSFGPPSCALKSQEIVVGDSIDPILLSVQPTAMLRVQVTTPSPAGHAPLAMAGARVSVVRDHSKAAVMYLTDTTGSASACVEVGAEYEVRATYDGMATTVVDGLKAIQGGKLDVPITLVPMRPER